MKSEDIAKLAGVSRSTVSRVINNYSNVPEETRKKVEEVINAHNYHPNNFARTLAGKKSNTIGLFFIIKEDKTKEHRIFHNDFFAYYLDSLVDLANTKGYYVLVQTVFQENDYDKVKQAIYEKRIDGAILLGTQDDTLQKLNTSPLDIPLVLFDFEANQLDQYDMNKDMIKIVNSNDFHGIESSVSYLIELGHKKIGFVKGNESTRSAKARFNAYKQSMIGNGLEWNTSYIVEGEFLYQTAYERMCERLKEGDLPTAWICANDNMALATMDAIKEFGLNIPKDVSVMGFDNIPSSTQSVPKLSTIAPAFFDMSKKAISLLNHMIEDQLEDSLENEFEVELIIRESCSKI